MEPSAAPRSGLVTFAGVLALVVGLYNVVSGLAGVFDDDSFSEAASDVLFGISISVWGWIWIIVGVVQLVVGGLVIQRHPMGLTLGVGWAVVSATLSAFVIFDYPLWAVVVVGLDVIVLYALLINADEFA